jgi:hypothetical protein
MKVTAFLSKHYVFTLKIYFRRDVAVVTNLGHKKTHNQGVWILD